MIGIGWVFIEGGKENFWIETGGIKERYQHHRIGKRVGKFVRL